MLTQPEVCELIEMPNGRWYLRLDDGVEVERDEGMDLERARDMADAIEQLKRGA